MASACMKMSPDTFPASPKYPSYGWLSPRVSFSRDDVVATKQESQQHPPNKNADLKKPDFIDFEFRLNDPTAMLTADQLFSNGKLVPTSTQKPTTSPHDVIPPETQKTTHKNDDVVISPTDFSPKAPKCSSRWKDFLGLKKQCSNTNDQKGMGRSFKNLLQRNTKTNFDSPSMRLPLLNELESDSVTVSGRLSLSSSSSSGGHEHEDLPRLSLDLDKPSTSSNSTIPPRNGRVRTVRHRSSLSSDNSSVARGAQQQRSSVRKAAVTDGNGGSVGLTVDSPRMNSSGKIVFQSLERSSSSPSSFNGGQKYRHKGMERSYSANVRVTPVLNVPVCSLRGFPLFSYSQVKKENGGSKNEKNLSKNRST